MTARRVILLHGLGHSSYYMSVLASRLRSQGMQVENFGYPSRRGSLAEQTERLAASLSQFSGERLSFVAHSLGGIIVRNLALRQSKDLNLRRLVMLGPPNQGSAFARGLLRFPPRKFLWGPVFEELAHLDLAPATDLLEIGIIAGAFPLWPWPFLKGAHDGIVTVEETKLPGAKDHVVLLDVHASLPFSLRAARLTKRFLETGNFHSTSALKSE